MTEKEKMLAGEWFHPNDAELEQDRTRARHLTHRLNVTLKDKDATYLATLRELCPGVEAMIRAPFYCDYGYNISIGKGSYVNFNCVFLDLGPIRLGQRCLIGPGVQLLTAVHPMDATERATGKEKGAGIEIGDDCWLGGGVIVCPGVKIGCRCVIGAGSVVTHDIPDDSVAAGNPARVIRTARNHRKIVVIDGRIGFVGGMNLAERYMRGFSWGIWRDTHLLLEGKAVHGLQTAFLLDWYFVDRTLITSTRYFPKIENCGTSLAQIVTSEPVGPWKDIMQGLVISISSAKKYFYIQTPYFLPTEAVLVAMQTAALSGVDVRLMLPMRADNRLTHLGSCSYLADVLYSGVKVYFYKKGFLHSKLMVSDDELSTVGSTNVDFRSFEHNFEVNAFIYDTETALQMREIFLQDQRDCVQVFLKNWVKRPWYRKAAESVVRLMAPLL